MDTSKLPERCHRPTLNTVVLALLTIATQSHAAPVTVRHRDFDDRLVSLAHYDGAFQPYVGVEGIRLLDGGANESNAAYFDEDAAGPSRHIQASFELTIDYGGEGASLVLLDTSRYGAKGPVNDFANWDDPRIPGSFAVAFDTSDPPTDDPFNNDRNIDWNAQREIALYWDGAEVTRILSPVEFRTSTPHAVDIDVDYVCGGANIDVSIDHTAIVDHYFIPSMQPYPFRPVIAGRSASTGTSLNIDNVQFTESGSIRSAGKTLDLTAFSNQPLDKDHGEQSGPVDFPADTHPYGRIICTLTLGKPTGGYDPWDRCAAVYAVGDDGARYEILRFITPYHHGYTWQADVTDMRPLLTGHRQIVATCTTYGTGWLTSVSFQFYRGRTDRFAYKVTHLWTGWAEIGNPEKPASTFFTTQEIVRDPQADFAKIRVTVTGHGQAPNTDDAAEFLPLSRTLTINGYKHTNMLWKTDNYLNPCSPQGGTWKYDRAGWGPGTIVLPWEIDATGEMPRGRESTLTYDLGDYVNANRDKGNPPVHWVESTIVYYKKA